jgi:hypothetical protein
MCAISILGLAFVVTGLPACASDEKRTSTNDGGTATGSGGAASGGRDASDAGHGAESTGGASAQKDDASAPDASSQDAATPQDAATSDSRPSQDGSDGNDATTCSAACPFHACDGVACAVTKLATPGALVWDVAIAGSGLYWTEATAIRTCALPGPCEGFGTLVAEGGLINFGLVTGRSADVDYLFTTDGFPDVGGLWRTGLSGTPSAQWGTGPDGSSAIAESGDVVVWGDRSAVYRSNAGVSGSTKVMDVGPNFVVGFMQSPAQHNVAVDGTTVFAASPADVYRCPVTESCVGKLVPAATTAMKNVVAMIIQDGTLYAIGGTPFMDGGTESLWAVPTAGGAATSIVTRPATGTGGRPFGLVADANQLYWGSFDENLYTCSRTSTCVPRVLVANARPFQMTQDASFIYWTDQEAIYRVGKRDK